MNEIDKDLPKIDNPHSLNLSDDNVVFNLIENVPIEPDNLPVPVTDISLKPEPPDIPEEGQTEGRHVVITCKFLVAMLYISMICLLCLFMSTIYETFQEKKL